MASDITPDKTLASDSAPLNSDSREEFAWYASFRGHKQSFHPAGSSGELSTAGLIHVHSVAERLSRRKLVHSMVL